MHISPSAPGSEITLPAAAPLAAAWGLDPRLVFLNHGSFGACPTAITDRQNELRERMEREPIRFFVEDLEGLLDHARHALAVFVNADAEGLVRVTNATEGVNTVLRSLRFQPGDELLTNSHEYNACNNALQFAAEQWGAKVVKAEVPWPLRDAGQVTQAVLAAVTERTRLVLLSHVTSPTGVVFPVEEIVRALNARGVDTLVDGAHAPGMVPLDLKAIDAAYYTGNCHKWMCAPKGAAFLSIRKDRRHLMRPLTISHGANSVRTDRSRLRLEFDYTGTRDVSGFLVLPELIKYMDGLVPGGWPGILFHNRELAIKGRTLLCREWGVPAPAPESMIASLAAVPITERTAQEAARPTRYHDSLQDRLIANWRVQAPVVVFPSGGYKRMIRIAAQLYNSIEQVEYLSRAVKAEIGRG
jgi:isopenicillin-N epimerase